MPPTTPDAPASLRLHLVRHGRTVYNVERRMQGWCDSPLTDEGEAGVRATARWLAEVPFVAAYASPLGRTVRTAQFVLAEHARLEPVLLDGLREVGFGVHEAALEAEIFTTIDPYAMFGSIVAGTFAGLPEGETGAAFRARVDAAFAGIVANHPDGGDVLVVSHGVTLGAYLAVVAAGRAGDVEPALTGPLENASVSVVDVGPAGVAQVLEVNGGPWTGRRPLAHGATVPALG